MSVWEVSQRIADIFAEASSLTNEDGEITDIDRLLELDMEQNELKEQLALEWKNRKAVAMAIKAEEDALYQRRKKEESAMQRITDCLSELCDGERLKTPRCEISFRKSKSVVIDDEDSWVRWAKIDRPDLLKFEEPKPSKQMIAKCLKMGDEIPGASLQESVGMSIK